MSIVGLERDLPCYTDDDATGPIITNQLTMTVVGVVVVVFSVAILNRIRNKAKGR